MGQTMRGLFLIAALFGMELCYGQAQELPAFRFSRRDQRAFTERDLPAGRPLFFVLFDADCPHCQRAVRSIDEQRAGFAKAAIILVSMDGWDKIERFVASYAPPLKAVVLRDERYQFIGRFKPR